MERTMERIEKGETEFSRKFHVSKSDETPLSLEFTASFEERQALAQRFGLVAIEAFTVNITVRRLRKTSVIRVEGRLSVTAVQTCVVTLVAFTQHVTNEFTELFIPSKKMSAFMRQGVGDIEVSEAFEYEEFIDLGEIAAQYFVLALDPYPRLPNQAPKETQTQIDTLTPSK